MVRLSSFVLRMVGAALAALMCPPAAVAAPPLPLKVDAAPTVREAAHPDTWHLQNNMMNLDASTRFVGSIVLNNPGESMVYVRSSAQQVAIVQEERKRLPIPDGALRVYPEEFVLRPGEAFTARLVADPDRIEKDTASYYVKFVDISNVRADELGAVDMHTAYLLGFEALVTVNKTPVPRIGVAQLQLTRDERDGGYALKNLSGHHLYLDHGGLCPPSKPMLVDCRVFPDFPRQSFLPDETVRFSASRIPSAPDDLVGVLVYGGLNQRDRADVVYLPARPTSSPTTASPSLGR